MKITTRTELIAGCVEHYKGTLTLEGATFEDRMANRLKVEAKMKADLKEFFPITFFNCQAIDYDSKTDRYVGKFYGGEEKSFKVKLSNEVAIHLMANREFHDAHGRAEVVFIYLHIDDKGAADDCLLVKEHI